MKTLKTTSGKEFDILWDGISFDYVLRAAVVNSTPQEIHNTFCGTDEGTVITVTEDEIQRAYEGEKHWRGYDIKPDGEIVIAFDLL